MKTLPILLLTLASLSSFAGTVTVKKLTKDFRTNLEGKNLSLVKSRFTAGSCAESLAIKIEQYSENQDKEKYFKLQNGELLLPVSKKNKVFAKSCSDVDEVVFVGKKCLQYEQKSNDNLLQISVNLIEEGGFAYRGFLRQEIKSDYVYNAKKNQFIMNFNDFLGRGYECRYE